MQSKAKTVKQYLAELPADRRAAIQAVREVILKNLDEDYQEGIAYGMIGYCVPHRVYPAGYHCDPKIGLPFASLASQKNHMALSMMSMYGDTAEEKWFRSAWAKTGKKLDMGKCCVRFKKLEDLPLDVIGEAFRRVPAKAYVAQYEEAREMSAAAPRKPASKTGKTVSKPSSRRRSTPRAGSRAAPRASRAR